MRKSLWQGRRGDPAAHPMQWRPFAALVMKGVGRLLRGLIRLYQIFLSPYLGRECRFQPTCSHYADEAITRHGPLKGGALAVRRLLRCHPWGGNGFDPVPDSGLACYSGGRLRRAFCASGAHVQNIACDVVHKEGHQQS